MNSRKYLFHHANKKNLKEKDSGEEKLKGFRKIVVLFAMICNKQFFNQFICMLCKVWMHIN